MNNNVCQTFNGYSVRDVQMMSAYALSYPLNGTGWLGQAATMLEITTLASQ